MYIESGTRARRRSGGNRKYSQVNTIHRRFGIHSVVAFSYKSTAPTHRNTGEGQASVVNVNSHVRTVGHRPRFNHLSLVRADINSATAVVVAIRGSAQAALISDEQRRVNY